MINCVAIDDEPSALDVISIHASKIEELNLTECFSDPQKGLEYLKNNVVDLLFLDINMPNISGLELLKMLHAPPLVVFTTAYSKYAMDSYDYDAVDYLLKPIVFDRFYKSVLKVKKQLQVVNTNSFRQEEFFFVKDGYDQIKIVFNEISHVKSQGNYLDVYTEGKKITIRMTFTQLAEQIPNGLLVRIHNSYMINIQYIDRIGDNHVFIGDATVPVGITYREYFYQKVLKI